LAGKIIFRHRLIDGPSILNSGKDISFALGTDGIKPIIKKVIDGDSNGNKILDFLKYLYRNPDKELVIDEEDFSMMVNHVIDHANNHKPILELIDFLYGNLLSGTDKFYDIETLNFRDVIMRIVDKNKKGKLSGMVLMYILSMDYELDRDLLEYLLNDALKKDKNGYYSISVLLGKKMEKDDDYKLVDNILAVKKNDLSNYPFKLLHRSFYRDVNDILTDSYLVNKIIDRIIKIDTTGVYSYMLAVTHYFYPYIDMANLENIVMQRDRYGGLIARFIVNVDGCNKYRMLNYLIGIYKEELEDNAELTTIMNELIDDNYNAMHTAKLRKILHKAMKNINSDVQLILNKYIYRTDMFNVWY
jgi:hypothetical protein